MDKNDYDVVVIGGGVAGMVAAIFACRMDKRVAIISKGYIGFGSTKISGGLIACSGLMKNDSARRFADDLIKGGEYINDSLLVYGLAKNSKRVPKILEELGHVFTKNKSGEYNLSVIRHLGGHSVPRTLMTVGEGVGLARTLRCGVLNSTANIFENTYVTDLLVKGNMVGGVLCYEIRSGESLCLRGKSVIIATGGMGSLFYPNTTCFEGSTGDGMSLALEAGAELIDMEQIQFIPFGITHPKSYEGLFCGEPETAGPYGRLLDRNGRVVARSINKMTRSELSRIIAMNALQHRGTMYGGLSLDLSRNLSKMGRKFYDKIMGGGSYDIVKKAYGMKAFQWKEKWDVFPSAHFTCGGIKVTTSGKTSVFNLFAIGEAAGGVHGANRLGSTALTEALVYGKSVGENCGRDRKNGFLKIDVERNMALNKWPRTSRKGEKAIRLKERVTEIIRRNVGIVRDEHRLEAALKGIKEIEDKSKEVSISISQCFNSDVIHYFELRSMLNVSRAIIMSALERKESRGSHIRSDYPRKSAS